MALPLMPKATAVWLLENTTLTFVQVAEFTGLHELEIQAIADGEVAAGMVGLDPIVNGQLTLEEIQRCAADPKTRLRLIKSDLPKPLLRAKGPRYTPVTKRSEKPDAVAWLIKHHPDLLDAQIARLIGTTKETIDKVRGRTHWNSQNIKPQNPVLIGLCTQADLDKAVGRAQRALARKEKEAARAAAAAHGISLPDTEVVAEDDEDDNDLNATNPAVTALVDDDDDDDEDAA